MYLALQVSTYIEQFYIITILVVHQKYFQYILILYQDCGEHELTTAVINESEVCNMKILKKNQIFVYDKFEGPAFQHVLPAAKQNTAV